MSSKSTDWTALPLAPLAAYRTRLNEDGIRETRPLSEIEERPKEIWIVSFVGGEKFNTPGYPLSAYYTEEQAKKSLEKRTWPDSYYSVDKLKIDVVD